METDEDLGIVPGEDAFSAAADRVAHAVVNGPRPSEAVLLQLYGLYKQATAGDCSDPRPWFWQWAQAQKWRSWNRRRGTAKQHAMQQYTQLANQALGTTSHPSNSANSSSGGAHSSKGGGLGGPVMSRLAYGTDPHPREAAGAQSGSCQEAAGSCSLHEVAGSGDIEALARQLDSGLCGVNDRDENGCTPLHFAADRGQLRAMQLLLARGADLNARDSDGQTPLHYAAMCGQKEVYHALLEADADPSIPDSDGQLPKDVADWEG